MNNHKSYISAPRNRFIFWCLKSILFTSLHLPSMFTGSVVKAMAHQRRGGGGGGVAAIPSVASP